MPHEQEYMVESVALAAGGGVAAKLVPISEPGTTISATPNPTILETSNRVLRSALIPGAIVTLTFPATGDHDA